ncbi:MAG: biosynthetic-type acetolactate synthase large subunit [Fastidiosipilaceae bacterium]|jgi:acetolactate synthase-1/2/3 large subunit
MKIKGADLFVKALQAEGVEKIFAYPGGTAIDLFDALFGAEGIEMVFPHHEQALVHAADGYARATGKVGVCLVTSGPGVTNTVTGIATANFDSVPLVVFSGQVASSLVGNDAFQEVDAVGIMRNISKWSITVHDREDLGRIIKEAFYIARTGKPGPVLVDIPKDVQITLGGADYPEDVQIRSYKPNERVHLGQLKKAISALEAARKPIFLIGGGVNIARANEAMTRLTELTNVPVITTLMGKGAVPTGHPLYIGNIGIHGNYASNHAISEADLIFSIGCRFNDRITGKLSTFATETTIVHVDIDPASISRNIVVDIPIVGDANDAILNMLDLCGRLDIDEWVERIRGWQRDFPIQMEQYDGLTAEKIIRGINENFDDVIVTTDVGQNQLWTTQYIELDHKKRLLTSGGLGTMGYGFPAAIGAQIGYPDRDVVSINGDGGFQMNMQELATAVKRELPIIIVIMNNGYLGNVRQWQEMFYNGRYSQTCMMRRRSCDPLCSGPNENCPEFVPDFCRVADAYNMKSMRVTEEEGIVPALLAAKANKETPTLIEFIIEREANVLPMVPPGEALDDMILEY